MFGILGDDISDIYALLMSTNRVECSTQEQSFLKTETKDVNQMMIPIAILAIENDEDRIFMEGVYEEYQPMMFRIARSILRNMEDAEDAVNDATLSLIRNLATIKRIEICKLRYYIVNAIENTCRDVLRKRKRYSDKELYDAEDILPVLRSHEPATDDRLIREAEKEELKRALSQMTERLRTFLEMKYLLDLPDKQIAEHMGVKASSVRQYLTMARRDLAKILASQSEGGH